MPSLTMMMMDDVMMTTTSYPCWQIGSSERHNFKMMAELEPKLVYV